MCSPVVMAGRCACVDSCPPPSSPLARLPACPLACLPACLLACLPVRMVHTICLVHTRACIGQQQSPPLASPPPLSMLIVACGLRAACRLHQVNGSATLPPACLSGCVCRLHPRERDCGGRQDVSLPNHEPGVPHLPGKLLASMLAAAGACSVPRQGRSAPDALSGCLLAALPAALPACCLAYGRKTACPPTTPPAPPAPATP